MLLLLTRFALLYTAASPHPQGHPRGRRSGGVILARRAKDVVRYFVLVKSGLKGTVLYEGWGGVGVEGYCDFSFD